MPIADEWSGFADLLANLIEQYAADLDIDNMPITTDEVNEGFN